MASALSDRLSRIVKEMRGQARITESNVTDMLREVRMALLEADVALPVVRDFIARVKEKALGTEVVGSLNPGQALVGVVHKELAATMGEGVADINLATQPPAVILMAGLQGAGKTTTTGENHNETLLQPRRLFPLAPHHPGRDRKSTRLNSSHNPASRMPSSA
jgi:signal recognition particle subunit SRP54